MEYRKRNIEDLMSKEKNNYRQNEAKKSNSDSIWYLYTAVGLSITSVAVSSEIDWLYVPGIAFCAAGVLDAASNFYHR